LPPFSRGGGERQRLVRPAVLAATVLLVALLAPLALKEEGFLPDALLADERRMLGAALASIALFGAQRHVAAAWRNGRAPPALFTVFGIAVAGASLVLRRTLPAPLCIVSWIGLGAFALAAASRAPRTLVELAALASYAWVSRDAEIPLLLATYVVATVV